MEILYDGATELGIDLAPDQLEQFEAYYREIIEWNRKMNLTRITGYEEVQVKQFLDSLTVIPQMDKYGNEIRIIDVGSGVGMPGIPVKIVCPSVKMTLLEATAKKVQFLRYVIDKLGLEDFEVINGRAEEIAHQHQYRERYDMVLSRAVATLPVAVELALPFCIQGGLFITQKKGNIEQEISQSSTAIAEMGGELRDIKQVEIKRLNDGRKIVVIEKVKPTPARYPRRPGMPAKRPIL